MSGYQPPAGAYPAVLVIHSPASSLGVEGVVPKQSSTIASKNGAYFFKLTPGIFRVHCRYIVVYCVEFCIKWTFYCDPFICKNFKKYEFFSADRISTQNTGVYLNRVFPETCSSTSYFAFDPVKSHLSPRIFRVRVEKGQNIISLTSVWGVAACCGFTILHRLPRTSASVGCPRAANAVSPTLRI